MLFYRFPISSEEAHSFQEQFVLLLCPAPEQQRLIWIRSLGALPGQLLRHIEASEKLCGGGLRSIAFVKQSAIDVMVQVYAHFVADLADLA